MSKELKIDDIDMLEEENILQKLAQATARAVDIQLGKTTLAELLDGYTKYIVLQRKIDKAIKLLEEDKYSASFNTTEQLVIKLLKGEEK